MSANVEGDLLNWTPFHVKHWPPMIAEPAQYTGGERLKLSWDLGALDDKRKKAAIKAWSEQLPTLHQTRWLSLWSQVTPPVFEAACRLPALECLQVKLSNLKSLDGIENLGQLRYLWIGSSTRVESLAPLASLARLELLSIENFKLITDFTPLEKLTKLQVLEVTGSMWTRQQVGTLEPFARMTWLRGLSLDTAGLDTLAPLASLKGLRYLGLSGGMPMEEYARLAAALPETECRWFRPWLDLAGTGIGKCPQCSRETRVMLTGKGSRVSCRVCDAARVKKHEAAFEKVYREAEQE